jgi:hypothetical protein
MSQNEAHELPDTPRDRPILPPVIACKLCNLGMIGVLGVGPLAFGNESLFFALGDVSFKVLPIVLFPIAAGAAFMQNYLNRQIQLGTIASLIRFNLIVRLLIGFYAVSYSLTILLFAFAKTPDAASFYFGYGILLLTLGLPLPIIFWWTLHRYRWFDPSSKPSEWELRMSPEGAAK